MKRGLIETIRAEVEKEKEADYSSECSEANCSTYCSDWSENVEQLKKAFSAKNVSHDDIICC